MLVLHRGRGYKNCCDHCCKHTAQVFNNSNDLQKKHKLALPYRWQTQGTDPWNLLLWSCRTSKAYQVAQPRRSGAVGRNIWRPEVHNICVWFTIPTWIVLVINFFLVWSHTAQPTFTECIRCMSLSLLWKRHMVQDYSTAGTKGGVKRDGQEVHFTTHSGSAWKC